MMVKKKVLRKSLGRSKRARRIAAGYAWQKLLVVDEGQSHLSMHKALMGKTRDALKALA